MSLFFSSDQHFHHVRALELMPLRPWKTLDEMNQGLIDHHNMVVGPNDVVIYLGDLVMGQKAITVPDIVNRLNGQKYLILGNHDAGFQMSGPKFQEKIQIYLDNGIGFVQAGAVDLVSFLTQCGEEDMALSLGDLAVTLCHFPYKGVADHADTKERYYELKPDPASVLLLHGHTHQSYVRTGAHMRHIGVDSWGYKPVLLDNVIDDPNQQFWPDQPGRMS